MLPQRTLEMDPRPPPSGRLRGGRLRGDDEWPGARTGPALSRWISHDRGTLDFKDFEKLAHRIFESIPDDYREGIDGLEVRRAAVPHPSLPEVFTLGECVSEYYPTEFGGAGEVLSMVVVYYGSFQELSRRQPDWDWEGELWETITHEVRHHLESLAAEDALEVQDYAEDQNFARREGEAFEPFYYRSGTAAGEDAYEIDGDVFVEIRLTDAGFEAMREVRVAWGGRELRAPRPARLGDVHFVEIGPVSEAAASGGELLAVLVRRRGPLGWLRGVLGGGKLEVLQTRHPPPPAPDNVNASR